MRFPAVLAVAFFVFFHCAECPAAAPTCLSKRQAEHVEAAQSIMERLQSYAEIGRHQASRAVGRGRLYDRWHEQAHTLPGHLPVPTMDDILRRHDCAWKAFLMELERWCSCPSASKQELILLTEKVDGAHRDLRKARIAVDWAPELYSVIESSLKLLTRVQNRIDRLIVTPIPLSAPLPP